MGQVVTIFDDGKSEPASIQGEQQQASATLWATDDEVDAYVRRVAAGVLRCRARSRHLFDPVDEDGMRFVRVTREGLLVRVVPCESCEKVNRVELWDVRHKGDKVTRAELVTASLGYKDPSYLSPPGTGRMRPQQIRNAIASMQLGGTSYRAVLKAAEAAAEATRAEAAAAVRELAGAKP